MDLKEFGYNDSIEKLRIENNLDAFNIGRIISEHKERYIVRTENGDFEAEVTGNLRFSARSREDFPAVGDWVALINYDTGSALIHKVLPRTSIIRRQAVGQTGEVQVIATNIDYAFLVQAADRDFSINRLERYLTICYSSKVEPIIVLTKTDLVNEQGIDEMEESIRSRLKDIPVIPVSNTTGRGIESLENQIIKGKTYCMLGSSGAGKSTLLNKLAGKPLMKTSSISESSNRGRHITSHRELVVLDNGGILIDNPGMREVGLADTNNGLETTFDDILRISGNCRYKNCSHTNEPGCAVIGEVEKGNIDKESYRNYLKLEREKSHFESTVAEKRKKDKDLAKIVKNYKKDMSKNKYRK